MANIGKCQGKEEVSASHVTDQGVEDFCGGHRMVICTADCQVPDVILDSSKSMTRGA